MVDINIVSSEVQKKPFILALVNPGSGGQAGASILKHFQSELTESQGACYSLVAAEGEIRYDGLWFQWHVLDK